MYPSYTTTNFACVLDEGCLVASWTIFTAFIDPCGLNNSSTTMIAIAAVFGIGAHKCAACMSMAARRARQLLGFVISTW